MGKKNSETPGSPSQPPVQTVRVEHTGLSGAIQDAVTGVSSTGAQAGITREQIEKLPNGTVDAGINTIGYQGITRTPGETVIRAGVNTAPLFKTAVSMQAGVFTVSLNGNTEAGVQSSLSVSTGGTVTVDVEGVIRQKVTDDITAFGTAGVTANLSGGDVVIKGSGGARVEFGPEKAYSVTAAGGYNGHDPYGRAEAGKKVLDGLVEVRAGFTVSAGDKPEVIPGGGVTVILDPVTKKASGDRLGLPNAPANAPSIPVSPVSPPEEIRHIRTVMNNAGVTPLSDAPSAAPPGCTPTPSGQGMNCVSDKPHR